MMRRHTFALQYFIDALPDSFKMPLGVSRAKDEVVRERTQGSHVQHGNIPRLLLRSKFGSQVRYFCRFQKGTNLPLHYTTYGNP